MAGKGGGAWKVAYADFVTAMMAFFLVMWITGQNEQVRKAIAQHFREPYRASKASEDAALPPFLRRPSTGRYAPAAAKPSVNEEAFERGPRPPSVRLRDGDRTHIGVAVLFAEDSATLDAAGQEELKKLAPQLAGKPQRIEIRGHASRRPLDPSGPFPDAWRLCYARCQATLEYLKALGIPEERIRMSQAGPAPALGTADELGPEIDSRVDVFLLSEIVPGAAVAKRSSAAAPTANEPAKHVQPHAGG
jgi:chemotaxis protein MotB